MVDVFTEVNRCKFLVLTETSDMKVVEEMMSRIQQAYEKSRLDQVAELHIAVQIIYQRSDCGKIRNETKCQKIKSSSPLFSWDAE